MPNLDVLAERSIRRSVVADARRFSPGLRTGDAELEIMSGWRQHGDRWMVWRFGDVRLEGYFASAHGAHAAGWRRWLETVMTPAQWEAYQDARESGWAPDAS